MKLLQSLAFTVLAYSFGYSQNCNCTENYNWIKNTFEENDAGYQYIIDKKGNNAYQTHNQLTANRIAKISDYNQCKIELENWLKFFRQDHFYIGLTDQAKSNQKKLENFQSVTANPIQLEKFKKEILSKKSYSIEGLWKAKNLLIAVKKINNEFIGSVVETKSKYKLNDVIFKISADMSSATYFTSNYKPESIQQVQYLGNNVLQIGNRFFEREFPVLAYENKIKEYFQIKSSEKPFGYKKDENTVYIYIPTFDDSKSEIDQLFKVLHSEIIKTENLIIDIRDNTGGQDQSYSSVISYLYTNPIQLVLPEFYSTELNNQPMKVIIENPSVDEQTKKMYKELYDKLERNRGKFINLSSNENVALIKREKMLNFPKNVGIIINENNLSSAEEFIFMAKQSRKVKLFGRKTGGALDVSNMVDLVSPTGDFEFSYCVSRSKRIPDNAVDDMGIHPDYYFDSSIPEVDWIDKVKEIMSFWK